MALGKIALFLLVTTTFFTVCFGAVYTVGDSNGWSSRGFVDYNEWASAKDFHVGDSLIFAYNNQFHNLMQVTNQEFHSCNPISPIATYTSGSDTITLKSPGQFYFLCGAPGHCQVGQKVEITVTLPEPEDSLGSPSSTPYGSSPSSSPNEVVPRSSARSSAPALHFPKLELVVTTLVLCLFGYVF